MKSFVKIALFAIVAVNAIKISDDTKGETKVTQETTEKEIAVGKFAYKMAGPDTKSKSEQISADW